MIRFSVTVLLLSDFGYAVRSCKHLERTSIVVSKYTMYSTPRCRPLKAQSLTMVDVDTVVRGQECERGLVATRKLLYLAITGT